MANVNFIVLATIGFVALIANVECGSKDESSQSPNCNCEFKKQESEDKDSEDRYRCRTCRNCNRYVPNKCAHDSYCKMDRRHCMEILNQYTPTDKVTHLWNLQTVINILGKDAETISMNDVCIDLEWNIQLCNKKEIPCANMELEKGELTLGFDKPDISLQCVNITICTLANIRRVYG